MSLKKRRKLYSLSQTCFVCGNKLSLEDSTIEHVYSKWDVRRHFTGTEVALSHKKCNEMRGIRERDEIQREYPDVKRLIRKGYTMKNFYEDIPGLIGITIF